MKSLIHKTPITCLSSNLGSHKYIIQLWVPMNINLNSQKTILFKYLQKSEPKQSLKLFPNIYFFSVIKQTG